MVYGWLGNALFISLDAKDTNLRPKHAIIFSIQKWSPPSPRSVFKLDLLQILFPNYCINDTNYYIIYIYLDKFRNIFWKIFSVPFNPTLQ